ncbi:hypothetical protein VNO80_09967 [Phaseolus coccineus]|uniref:Uncharacterized protein n=1 Tax=Phaseolus coccineus TaxID=3886 RepID=A0AAN9N7R4_PHACN
MRRTRNAINGLTMNENWCEDPVIVKNEVKRYFEDRFSRGARCNVRIDERKGLCAGIQGEGDAENGPKHSCCKNNNPVGRVDKALNITHKQPGITLQKLVPEYIIMVCIE